VPRHFDVVALALKLHSDIYLFQGCFYWANYELLHCKTRRLCLSIYEDGKMGRVYEFFFKMQVDYSWLN